MGLTFETHGLGSRGIRGDGRSSSPREMVDLRGGFLSPRDLTRASSLRPVDVPQRIHGQGRAQCWTQVTGRIQRVNQFAR